MRYTISIDQTHSIEWNLSLSEAALFSFIYSLPAWAEQIHVNGQTWFFASRNKAIDEMPIITDKADTIYRLYKSLQSKGIIDWQKFGEKDCILITEKGKNWNSSKTDLGNKSESTRKKIRLKAEINPTYNSTKNNNTIDNSIDINTNVFMPEEEINEFSNFSKVETKSKVNPFSIISQIEKEKNCPKKEKAEPTERKPNPTYEAFTVFCETFERLSGANYPKDKKGNYIMSPKEAGGMVYLLRWLEKVDTYGNTIEALKVFVRAAWNLNDKWIRANFTPNTLYGQFSKIFTGYQTSSPEMIEKKKNDRIAELLAEKMKQYENQ
jgi:hypothetical protein